MSGKRPVEQRKKPKFSEATGKRRETLALLALLALLAPQEGSSALLLCPAGWQGSRALLRDVCCPSGAALLL